MPRGKLHCPLCGVMSVCYATPGNIFVKCPDCGGYRLTFLAHERFFMGHGSPVLNGEQKQKLRAYIAATSAGDQDTPVELSLEKIQKILGIQEAG